MQYIVDHNYASPQNAYTYSTSTAANPSEAFMQIFNNMTPYNDTGMPITQSRAIGSPPVWTSASKICGHLGQMPLDCMRWTNRNSEEAETDRIHPAQFILNNEFNEYVSADVGKETLALHSLLRGNGRALIIRNARMEAVELIILDPDQTSTVRVREKGTPKATKWHVWHDPESGEYFSYSDRDVFHIPGLSGDGFNGYDTINVAANSIGSNLVAERKSIRLMKNDSAPSILIEAPQGMFKEEADAKNFLENFKRAHTGDNQGSVGLLRGGMKAQTLSQTATEAQMIEQRKFSREDMALLFGVEQMLGIDKSVSYNSEEQRSKAYRVNCLGRWMTRWEKEASRKLLSSTQKRNDSHFFMWNDEILMQATLAERYEGYSKAISSRILNPNECRKKEGYKPYAGGDKYENPNTTAPVTAKEPVSNKPEPQPKQAANAVESHLNHLIGVEKKRLLQIAENPKRFIERVVQFYDGWKDRLGATIKQFGGDQYLVESWIDGGKSKVIKLADTATGDKLHEAVKTEIESWNERTETLIANIAELSL